MSITTLVSLSSTLDISGNETTLALLIAIICSLTNQESYIDQDELSSLLAGHRYLISAANAYGVELFLLDASHN